MVRLVAPSTYEVIMPTSVLHQACRRGDEELVRSLLAQNPSAVNVADEYGWWPIFHAALGRHEGIVKQLLDAGADLSVGKGYVMHFAGEVPNNKQIVAMLLQYGGLDPHVHPTSDLQRQFLAAVFLADVPRVRALLAADPRLAHETDGRGDYAIHHAARNGDTDIVRVLLDAGADVNARGKANNHTVLYCAGGHGHVDTVRLLLEAGADASARFTSDGKTLEEWLADFPEDPRLMRVAELLRSFQRGV